LPVRSSWPSSNVGLTVCNAYAGAWPMVALLGVYTVITAVGLCRWKTKRGKHA